MATSVHTGNPSKPHRPAVADRLIGITTSLAVAAVAAVIIYRARLRTRHHPRRDGPDCQALAFAVDGPILAASMLILDDSRRHQSVPPLARWSLGTGITATVGANLTQGLGHGPIGALVSAWPTLALADSFEVLMTPIRTTPHAEATASPSVTRTGLLQSRCAKRQLRQ